MASFDYLDFDLEIEHTAQGYRAEVVNSPGGQAAAVFQLPFAPLELENFLLRAGRPRQGVRGLDTTELETAKAFGQKLFTTVFDDEVRACLHASLQAAAGQGAGLRIRLRLDDAPELADLPWEFLYNAALNRFFTLSVETPLVRYLELPEPVRALKVTPPLRALVMIANPTDYETLDVEQEWSRLRTALAGLEARGLLTLERLDEATLPALQRRLRQQQYHIFHFIGHGGFDQGAGEGVLILEDDAGRGRAVGGEYVGTLLHDHRSLRLAVLNACEGGRASAKDSFAGVAQSLIQQGLPGVIAMQFPISDVAAITFARDFYGAVADGYPVDAALAEARKAILSDGGGLEWGTPVLFMRSDNGYIFEVENVPPVLAAATPGSAGQQATAVAPVHPPPATSGPEEPPRVTSKPRRQGTGRKAWVPAVALLLLLVVGALLAMRLLGSRLAPAEQAGEIAAGVAPTSVSSTENRVVTPVADAPDSASPANAADSALTAVVLEAGMEATAGKAVYRVLAARLEPRDSGTRALHLDVRVTNMDLAPFYIGAEAFRLLVDGEPLAPSEAPSIAVEGQSATEGEAVFVLPTTAGKVELQFGNSGTESSRLAIDLNARQESAPPTPAVPPLAQSLYVGGDMDITVSKIVYRIVAARLEPHSAGKRALRFDLHLTNSDLAPTFIGASAFRLFVDGVPLAPSEALSVAMDGQSSGEGKVVFVLPDTAMDVQLQIGNIGQETTRLPLDLRAEVVMPTPVPTQPFAVDQSRYPITLASGMEVTAANMVYRIVAAQLEPHSDDKRALRFDVHLTNTALAPTFIGASAFRLFVDGVPLAPRESLSVAMDGQSSADGEVVFVLPTTARVVELQIGNIGQETTRILVDLSPAYQ